MYIISTLYLPQSYQKTVSYATRNEKKIKNKPGLNVMGFQSEHECNLFLQAGSTIKGKRKHGIETNQPVRDAILFHRGRDVIQDKDLLRRLAPQTCIKENELIISLDFHKAFSKFNPNESSCDWQRSSSGIQNDLAGMQVQPAYSCLLPSMAPIAVRIV